jgi:dephospho-CoA kinase
MSSESERIPVIAIVGGIASGKTTVAAAFGRLGCAVLDADRMAHEMLADPLVQQELVSSFGIDILDGRGGVDRRVLAGKVFRSAEDVRRINAIIHPRVMDRCRRAIEQNRVGRVCKAIVLDVPLLLEAGWEGRFDCLVFVECDSEIRLRRAAGRGLSAGELKNRENFQISLDIKRKMADYIIDSNSDLSAIADQVERIFTILVDRK